MRTSLISKYIEEAFDGVPGSRALQDFKEEIAGHLSEKVRDHMNNGVSEVDANQAAIMSVGDIRQAYLDRHMGRGRIMAMWSGVTGLWDKFVDWTNKPQEVSENKHGEDSHDVAGRFFGVDESYVEFREGSDHVVVYNTHAEKDPLKIPLTDIVEVYFGPPLLRPGVWDMSMMYGYGYWNFLVLREGDTKIVGFRIKEVYQVCVRQGPFGAPSKKHPSFERLKEAIMASVERAKRVPIKTDTGG